MISSDSTQPRKTYLLSFIFLAVFFILGLKELAGSRTPALIGITAIVVLALVSIICFHRRWYTSEAFTIPLALFAVNTGLSIITGNYNYFFVFYLGICCFTALFLNNWKLLKFMFVSNSITAVLLLSGAAGERYLGWLVCLISSVFIHKGVVYTEVRSSEARKAQDSFVGLLVSTPDPTVLLDSLNRVTYISNSFMKLINMDRSLFAKDRSIFDLIKDRALRELVYNALSERDFSKGTYEVIMEGQPYFFEIVIFELASEFEGRLVSIIDITPVMKARYEAEAASKSKSSFLAAMSHEIRTPLNVIIGLSGIALQKKLPPDVLADIEKIHSSGENLLAIINDILDISKIEAGSFELVLMSYDVPSMINDTIQLNAVLFHSKNILFKVKIDETIPTWLLGDELRIKQILNNILTNAYKYTDKGSVVFTVNWEVEENDAWISFSVKDTGRGIKQEDFPKLFSEFRQLDVKANRNIEGTGLGLSITKNLISLMKGSITVESKYGRGSTFTVKIPQRIVDNSPIGEVTVKNLESFRFENVHRSQGMWLVQEQIPYGKVLVVDDIEMNLDVAKGLLLPYGISIDTASSGQEAIAKIRAIDNDETGNPGYDLIFMDHMMPGMDGMEAVKIIRNELSGDYAKTVPIVALTANALVGNEEVFLNNGFNAFISKPIDVAQLDMVLNTWVRNKKDIKAIRQSEMTNSKKRNSDILSDTFLDGINLTKVREHYRSEKIYLDILRSWCIHTPPLLEKIKNPSENLREYTITVHGIKGASLGICADAIGEKAGELESRARDGDIAFILAENPGFITSVEELVIDMGELLKKIETDKVKKQRKPAPDPQLLAELLDSVKRYKSALMENTLNTIETFDYDSGGELVVWLREQLDNLEYDAIRNRLEAEI